MWYYAKTINRCNKNILHYFRYIIVLMGRIILFNFCNDQVNL